jgi:hypothetical protein
MTTQSFKMGWMLEWDEVALGIAHVPLADPEVELARFDQRLARVGFGARTLDDGGPARIAAQRRQVGILLQGVDGAEADGDRFVEPLEGAIVVAGERVLAGEVVATDRVAGLGCRARRRRGAEDDRDDDDGTHQSVTSSKTAPLTSLAVMVAPSSETSSMR